MTTEDFLLHVEDGALYVEIPKFVYEELNIEEGDSLSLGVERGKITLTKVKDYKK